MQTHHLTGPGELIAAIPLMIGEKLSSTTVVVGVAGAGEIVSVARAAHTDLEIPEVARALGSSMAATLRAHEAQRAVVISFTREDVTMGCAASDALRPRLENAVDSIDVWACNGESFVAPGCADRECCPPGGHPVPATGIAGPVRTSIGPVGHAAPACDDTVAPQGQRRSAARGADRWAASRGNELDEWRCESWDLCAAAYALDAPAPLLGRAIASLQDVRVRDALIVEWLGGGPSAIADTLLGHDSHEVIAVLDAAMGDPATPPPVPAKIVASLRWCRRLIAHARQREQAPMHTLCAVALWWGGDLAAAMDSARRALHRDPAYSLAVLVSDICAAGVSPAWQREQEEQER